MIQPIRRICFNTPNFTSAYDTETEKLLDNAAGLFDKEYLSSTGADVFIYSESGDVDLVANLDNKEVALSRLSKGNILLQVADKDTETVNVLYHNISDCKSDRFLQYNDTKIFPWNGGRDVKLTSDYVADLKSGKLSQVESMCKEYIPRLMGLFNKMLPAQLLKK